VSILEQFGGFDTTERLLRGRVSRVDGDYVYAVIPSFNMTHEFGPMRAGEGAVGVGDAVLIAFDTDGQAWLVSWDGAMFPEALWTRLDATSIQNTDQAVNISGALRSLQGGGLRTFGGDSSTSWIWDYGNRHLRFATNNLERMRIRADGTTEFYRPFGATQDVFTQAGGRRSELGMIEPGGMEVRQRVFIRNLANDASNRRLNLFWLSRDTANWNAGTGVEIIIRTEYFAGGGVTRAWVGGAYSYPIKLKITGCEGRSEHGLVRPVWTGESAVSGTIVQGLVYVDLPAYVRAVVELRFSALSVVSRPFNAGGQLAWEPTTEEVGVGAGTWFDGRWLKGEDVANEQFDFPASVTIPAGNGLHFGNGTSFYSGAGDTIHTNDRIHITHNLAQSHLSLGKTSATDGQRSASIQFLGFGVDHHWLHVIPSGTAATRKFSFARSASDDPDATTQFAAIHGDDSLALGSGTDAKIRRTASGEITVEAKLKTQAGELVPIGAILPFAGSTAPTGYKLCDGASYSTTTEAALFAVIGYAYGGSGANFNVPDTRGKMIAGRNASDAAFDVLGETGGAKTVTLTALQSGTRAHSHGVTDPSHAHGPGAGTYFVESGISNVGAGTGFDWGLVGATAGAFTGISIQNSTAVAAQDAHENLPPYVVLNHIIRAS
jgi:microcystin-dependent protein